MLDGETAPRPAAVVAFQQQSSDLQRAVMGASNALGEAITRVQALRRAIAEAPRADDKLATDARILEARLRDLQTELSGDNTMSRRSEPTPPSLMSRLGSITNNLWSNSLDAPTSTHRRQYDIVATEFAKILGQLRPLMETELRRVEDAAEAAGAPWTSGRLPAWSP